MLICQIYQRGTMRPSPSPSLAYEDGGQCRGSIQHAHNTVGIIVTALSHVGSKLVLSFSSFIRHPLPLVCFFYLLRPT